MKRTICLIFCFLFSGLVFGQKGQHVIGIQLGSAISTKGLGTSSSDEFNTPIISPSGSIFYDWSFNRQFGLNVGADYRIESQKVRGFCGICFPFNEPLYKLTYNYLELPVNLALNLNRKETADLKTYFLLGYTYSYLLTIVTKDLRTGNILEEDPYRGNYIRNKHYLNLGLEVRYNINDKYSFGFSPFARILISEEIDASFVGLKMKFGRIL